MNQQRRANLIHIALVVLGVLEGVLAARAAAWLLAAALGERTIFSTADSVPLAGLFGGVFGGVFAATSSGLLECTPLRWVLLVPALAAASGGFAGGLVGAAIGAPPADIAGGFWGALVGFAGAVLTLKRIYPQTAVSDDIGPLRDAV